MSFIQTYFLRMYCIERERCDDEAATYRDALFQARLLVFIPAVGLSSTAMLVVGKLSSRAWTAFIDYREAITVALVACLFFVSFRLVGHAVAKIDNIPMMAEQYATPRDRLLSHVQFYCTLVLSSALPFVVAMLLPGPLTGHGG
jgi:hypothetical protein